MDSSSSKFWLTHMRSVKWCPAFERAYVDFEGIDGVELTLSLQQQQQQQQQHFHWCVDYLGPDSIRIRFQNRSYQTRAFPYRLNIYIVWFPGNGWTSCTNTKTCNSLKKGPPTRVAQLKSTDHEACDRSMVLRQFHLIMFQTPNQQTYVLFESNGCLTLIVIFGILYNLYASNVIAVDFL